MGVEWVVLNPSLDGKSQRPYHDGRFSPFLVGFGLRGRKTSSFHTLLILKPPRTLFSFCNLMESGRPPTRHPSRNLRLGSYLESTGKERHSGTQEAE